MLMFFICRRRGGRSDGSEAQSKEPLVFWRFWRDTGSEAQSRTEAMYAKRFLILWVSQHVVNGGVSPVLEHRP